MSDIPQDIMQTAWETWEHARIMSIGADQVAIVARAIASERERCAKIASMFTMKPDRSIHPDIPWDQMDDAVKITAHTTAQQIAEAIMAVE